MPHIHTANGQHDITASAYIVRLDGAEPQVILHWHKKLHKYLQFGGHVELNETPWQAVTHELKEESGYDIHQLNVLQPKRRLQRLTGSDLHPYPVSIQTHPFGTVDHYHTDIAYAFTTIEAPASAIQVGESSSIRLFTAQELDELSSEDIIENVRETCHFILDECLAHWEAVSGPAEH